MGWIVAIAVAVVTAAMPFDQATVERPVVVATVASAQVIGQESLGGQIVDAPSAAAWGPDRVDAFVRGIDDGLYHMYWSGSTWSSWEPLGGVLTSAPAVTSWGPNRLDIVVRGADAQLWHRAWFGSFWGPWEPLGGVLTSAPAVASWGTNRLDIFVAGADAQLWSLAWLGSAGWSGWAPLGAPAAGLQPGTAPAAESWAPGRIDLLAVDNAGRSMRRPYNGRWGSWSVSADVVTSTPAVASWAPGRLDHFWRGSDGSLVHAFDAPPPFRSSVRTVTAAELWASWRPGCPVAPEELRMVDVDIWGFDGAVTAGAIVVHWTYAEPIRAVLHALFLHGYPINRLAPVEAHGGSDDAVMAANTSSGFNCRAVTGGTGWSEHAYGRAVDINPVQNPYVSGSLVLPGSGWPYLDRARTEAGMITSTGTVLAAFSGIGWPWGGNWTSLKDYMHFSSTGR
jgi:hypothetical protein